MTFIGIDGGGTSTRVLVQRGEEQAEYYERAVSIKVGPAGRAADFESAARKLRKLLVTGKVAGKAAAKAPRAIAIGLSGMSREEDQRAFVRAIRALPEFRRTKVHVEGDASLTLKAVLGEEREGILMIIGTGSVLYYRAKGEPARRIGGWGLPLSDDGSGYRLGMRALRHYIRMLDGVVPEDTLTEAVARQLPEEVRKDQRALSRWAENNQTRIVAFAKDALDAAEESPNVTDQILEELIELFAQVLMLYLRGILTEKPLKIYLVGSVAKHPFVKHALEQGMPEPDMQLIAVDDWVVPAKALEIARSL